MDKILRILVFKGIKMEIYLIENGDFYVIIRKKIVINFLQNVYLEKIIRKNG